MCRGDPARGPLVGALRHLAARAAKCSRDDGLPLAGMTACSTFPPFPSREGPGVRIRLPPPRSLSHWCLPWVQAQRAGLGRECEPRRDQRTGRAGHAAARLGCFSLTGIDAVPPREIRALNEKSPAWAWAHSVGGRSSARQEAVLIGPVERQIEFGQTRRSECDGLSALQNYFHQLGAQKGEGDEAPDIATGDAVALGQFPQRS